LVAFTSDNWSRRYRFKCIYSRFPITTLYINSKIDGFIIKNSCSAFQIRLAAYILARSIFTGHEIPFIRVTAFDIHLTRLLAFFVITYSFYVIKGRNALSISCTSRFYTLTITTCLEERAIEVNLADLFTAIVTTYLITITLSRPCTFDAGAIVANSITLLVIGTLIYA